MKSLFFVLAFAFTALSAPVAYAAADTEMEPTDSEIEALLGATVESYRDLALKDISHPESANLLKAADAIEKVSKDPAQRSLVGKGLRGLLIGTKRASSLVTHTLGHAGTDVDLLISLPFRTTFKFFRGLVSGKANRAKGRSLYQGMTLGSGARFWPSFGLMWTIAGQTALEVATGGFMLLSTADYIVAANCDVKLGDRNLGELTNERKRVSDLGTEIDALMATAKPGEPLSKIVGLREKARERDQVKESAAQRMIGIKFCLHVEAEKNVARSVTDSGDKAGAWIHNSVAKIFRKKDPKPAEPVAPEGDKAANGS